MKTMTCRQLGGPCDLALPGQNANDVIKAQDKHLKDAVAGGDDAHKAATERHAGPMEEPHRRHGLVSPGQARLRRAARGIS